MNEILLASEVMGSSFSYNRVVVLANFMSDCGLIDLDSVGGVFTWHRHTSNGVHIHKRLDRCMVNSFWRTSFPHALVELLPPHNSYHKPFLSCFKSQSYQIKSFIFQATQNSHPNYGPLVKQTWNNVLGNAIVKLGKITEESNYFNKETFGNIFRHKCHLEARLRGVHRVLDTQYYSDMAFLERSLQRQLDSVLAQEEMIFQKSRKNWVKLGNNNTKFFHTQSIIRRRKNKVIGLWINDILCSDEEALKTEANSFFQEIVS